MAWFMGIDIGSETSKGVITKDGKCLAYHLFRSGVNHSEVAKRLKKVLLREVGLRSEDIACTVATGKGAGSVSFSSGQVSDVRCCARGVSNVFPSARTIIDVGGQSSQVIRINAKGQVTDFLASEKCAAGSGRFLQIIANVLRIDLKEIGMLSLRSKNPVTFTTGCAVFGESEAISRVAEGFSKEDILAGVHRALANKISAILDRVGLEMDCAISGGGGLDEGLTKSIEEKRGIQLLVPPQPQIIVALGAAIMAQERQKIIFH
jgi:predicted CoA-substrate-specific enzyme activase